MLYTVSAVQISGCHQVEATQIMRIRDNIVKMYSMMSGRTQEEITRALDRDNFMSAQDALSFGLIGT